jgi:hypothetical protein
MPCKGSEVLCSGEVLWSASVSIGYLEHCNLWGMESRLTRKLRNDVKQHIVQLGQYVVRSCHSTVVQQKHRRWGLSPYPQRVKEIRIRV